MQIPSPRSESEFRSGPFEHARLTISLGAMLGANSPRRQATSGHNEPSPSQVNGMLGYTQRRLATAQA